MACIAPILKVFHHVAYYISTVQFKYIKDFCEIDNCSGVPREYIKFDKIRSSRAIIHALWNNSTGILKK
jgi:hypothetical protein